MRVLSFDESLDGGLDGPLLVVALDGWTDAGRAGTLAAATLRDQWQARRVGEFDADELFDYRDRRPILEIDRGVLATPQWPSLEVFQLTPPSGEEVLLVTGGEPDFAWRRISADLVELAELTSATKYVGLGAVPAPVPHTRVTRIITTGSDEELLDRYGRPHEQLTVPASCQVVLEAALRDAGLTTLGLWARIPHYVAGEYPAGAHALLRHVADVIGSELDLSEVLSDAEDHRKRLDVAASGSDEILEHIHDLEHAYDEDIDEETGGLGPLPSADEIAAEFERFLRHQDDGPERT